MALPGMCFYRPSTSLRVTKNTCPATPFIILHASFTIPLHFLAEGQIARIAQAGNNVKMLVQVAVYCA
jgi:hypothetical protein